MNIIRELESSQLDITKIPISYLIGSHRLSDDFPTASDLQWEIIMYCNDEERDTFTIKALTRKLHGRDMPKDEEDEIRKLVLDLFDDGKIDRDEDDAHDERFHITEDTYNFE